MSELRVQRARLGDLEGTVDNRAPRPAGGGAAALLSLTTETTYPTTAGVYYAANFCDLGGAEVEGGTASFTSHSAVVYALNVGTQVPPSGTKVVGHAVGGRWIFRFDG